MSLLIFVFLWFVDLPIFFYHIRILFHSIIKWCWMTVWEYSENFFVPFVHQESFRIRWRNNYIVVSLEKSFLMTTNGHFSKNYFIFCRYWFLYFYDSLTFLFLLYLNIISLHYQVVLELKGSVKNWFNSTVYGEEVIITTDSTILTVPFIN